MQKWLKSLNNNAAKALKHEDCVLIVNANVNGLSKLKIQKYREYL